MRPSVFKGKLDDLPSKRKRQICKCVDRCSAFITIVGQEDFILCEAEAREHAFQVLRTLGIFSDIYTKPTPFWTTKDEQFIIDYIAKHGVHNGAYRIIAEHLGRSRDATKNKILRMRKEGKPV